MTTEQWVCAPGLDVWKDGILHSYRWDAATGLMTASADNGPTKVQTPMNALEQREGEPEDRFGPSSRSLTATTSLGALESMACESQPRSGN